MITLQEAQATAVRLVFEAVNSSGATPEAMQFQYMQMLPRLAENPANKVLVVPADMAGLAGLATSLAQVTQAIPDAPPPNGRSSISEGDKRSGRPALQQTNPGGKR